MTVAKAIISADRKLLKLGAALVAQHKLVMELHDKAGKIERRETKKQETMVRAAPKSLHLNGQDRLWLADGAAMHREVFDVYLLNRKREAIKKHGARMRGVPRERELVRVAAKYWKPIAPYTRASKAANEKAVAADRIAGKLADKITKANPPTTVGGILMVARAGRFLCSCPRNLDAVPTGADDDDDNAIAFYKIITACRQLLGARHD